MDESFFAAASDLDRILDELEETEASHPISVSVTKQKTLDVQPNSEEKTPLEIAKQNKHELNDIQNLNAIDKEPGHAVTKHKAKNIDETTKINNVLQNDEKSAVISTNLNSNLEIVTEKKECETGLLIDFSEIDVAIPEYSDKKLSDNSVASNVDFLLSNIELKDKSQDNVLQSNSHHSEFKNVNATSLLDLDPFTSLETQNVNTPQTPELNENRYPSFTKSKPLKEKEEKDTSGQEKNNKIVGFSDVVSDEALMDDFEQFFNESESTHPILNQEASSTTPVQKQPPTPVQKQAREGSLHENKELHAPNITGVPSLETENTMNRIADIPESIDNSNEIQSQSQDEFVDVPSTSGLNLDESSGETESPSQPTLITNEDTLLNPDIEITVPNEGGTYIAQQEQEQHPNMSPPSYTSVLEEDKAAQLVNDFTNQTQQEQLEVDQVPGHNRSNNEHHNNEEYLQPIRPTSVPVEPTEHSNASLSSNYVQRPGRIRPKWVPDENSPVCTNCGAKFSFTRRRHHCRACGRVFCSACGSEKSKLEYMEFAEARVCVSCFTAIQQADAMAQSMSESTSSVSPNLPSPPASGPRPVIKPNEDSPNGSGSSKSVRFSDGTRPDHPSPLPDTPPLPSRLQRMNKIKQRSAAIEVRGSSLPPLVVDVDDNGSLTVEEYPSQEFVAALLKPDNTDSIHFALSSNLFVSLQVVEYQSVSCYYFLSNGLDLVGQAEVAIILQVNPADQTIPLQAFSIFTYLFTNSRKGKAVHALDFVESSAVLSSDEPLLGQPNIAGVLFVRRSNQDISNLCVKGHGTQESVFSSLTVKFSSTLFALFVLKSEKPWASLFPSRFLLGYGAQHKEYPHPLGNFLNRKAVYQDVGNTILGILCDFRNFKYRVVAVPGLSVIIKEHGVVINIPVNRFTDITKILNSSNEHVLAVGSDAFRIDHQPFSSHIVAIQDEADLSYHTEVIERQFSKNDPNTGGTGAAFVVFNGSLKSGNVQQARCTVVEDGVMIQILPEKMASLKECLKGMDDFMINCGSALPSSPTKVSDLAITPTAGKQDACKFVEVRWVDDDTKFNIGLSSPIDFQSLEGVAGYNVQGKSEKKGKHHILRWNQVFFFKSTGDVLDMSRLAEQMAEGCFQALVPHLRLLKSSKQNKIGVRITIHPDDVGYAVGSQGLPLPDPCLNALDEQLIFLLHQSSAHLHPEDDVVTFELIFSVLDMRSNWKVSQ